MADLIDMPKLSDTMTVGTLAKWLKNEGDTIKSGDMLAEVETDKATMEVESFFDGVLLKIFVTAGAQVPIGTALCAIGKAGEKVDAPAAAAAPPAAEPAAAPAKSAPAKASAPAAAPAPATPAPSAAAPLAPGARLRISPLARKLAAEKGLDPATIAGSGPGGRIVRADVLAAGSGAAAARPAPASAPVAPTAAPLTGVTGEGKLTPASNMRAVVARRLLEAKTQIPHFYLAIEVNADPLLELRAQLNTSLEADGVKLSVNDFILKACAEALRSVPAVNCSWETGAGTVGIRQHDAAHVSFAVAIEDGLITPVIRDTQSKSLVTISKEARTLGKKAKDKKLAPADYSGGTFCVSNLGMMGIDSFCAIINPPNAAILAVGTTVKRPVVRGDKIVIGQTMTLTLSCDHRVVDGAVGAKFLAALRDLVEKPSLLLL
jgi:pyruvate dehydrogenase E2 component (dihydrolipoamide acetyltransferase)